MNRKEYDEMVKVSFGLITDYIKELKKERGYTVKDLEDNKHNIKPLLCNQYVEEVVKYYGEEKAMLFFAEMIGSGNKIHVVYKFDSEE